MLHSQRFNARGKNVKEVDVDEVISFLLLAYGLYSQAELADHLGIRRSAISNWRIRGEIPRMVWHLYDALKTKRELELMNVAALDEANKISASAAKAASLLAPAKFSPARRPLKNEPEPE